MCMLLHLLRFFRCGKNALIVLYFNSVIGSKNFSGLNRETNEHKKQTGFTRVMLKDDLEILIEKEQRR